MFVVRGVNAFGKCYHCFKCVVALTLVHVFAMLLVDVLYSAVCMMLLA